MLAAWLETAQHAQQQPQQAMNRHHRPSRAAKTQASVKIGQHFHDDEEKDEWDELSEPEEELLVSKARDKKVQASDQPGSEEPAEQPVEQPAEQPLPPYDPERPSHLVPGHGIAPNLLQDLLLCHSSVKSILSLRLVARNPQHIVDHSRFLYQKLARFPCAPEERCSF